MFFGVELKRTLDLRFRKSEIKSLPNYVIAATYI